MPFTDAQRKLMAGILTAMIVGTRDQRGTTLSYIEAWHAIAEANRIFGFDGWDRETLSAECVLEDSRRDPKACAYAARSGRAALAISRLSAPLMHRRAETCRLIRLSRSWRALPVRPRNRPSDFCETNPISATALLNGGRRIHRDAHDISKRPRAAASMLQAKAVAWMYNSGIVGREAL
jgi:hypothetical protein